MAGANIVYGNQARLQSRMRKLIGYRSIGHPFRGIGKKRFAYKSSATAPTDNTAADQPNRVGDFCVHYLVNGSAADVRISVQNEASTTHDWTSIIPV